MQEVKINQQIMLYPIAEQIINGSFLFFAFTRRRLVLAVLSYFIGRRDLVLVPETKTEISGAGQRCEVRQAGRGFATYIFVICSNSSRQAA